MTISDALRIIYRQLKETVGEEKAPSAFSITLTSIVDEVQEKTKFSPQAFEEAILEEAALCLRCSKNKDVA